MGQTLSYLKSYFEKSPQTPIDYSAGKNDKTEYFKELLPNIPINLDKSKKFIDPDFPHGIDAIFNKYNPLYKKDIEEDREEEKENYVNYFEEGILRWERISNILTKINIKKDLKKGIAQNGLGDCYLISFLRGFLKFQTEKFYKLLGNCHPEIGYWEVNFIIENKNIKVFVDDYIVLTEDLEPLFAGVREDNKFTVGIALIIEKAFAKLNGSYMNIEGHNQTTDSGYFFTGLPSITYNFSLFGEENIYNEVNKYLEKRNVVTCGTIDIEKGQPFPIQGIEENHEYLVTNKEIINDIKILRLNNPWGYNNRTMEDFDTDIKDKEAKMEIKKFNIKEENINSGELKVDIKSMMKCYDSISFYKFKNKDEEPPGGEKKPLPAGVPENGLDDGVISDLFDKRKGILDHIGVDSFKQKIFLQSFNKNPELPLTLLFYTFMNFGTNLNSFNAIFEGIRNKFKINSSNNEMNQNQIFDIFSQITSNLQSSYYK